MSPGDLVSAVLHASAEEQARAHAERAPAEPYYPAHASLPVEDLRFPGAKAWGTGAEMAQALLEELKAHVAQSERRAA